MKHLLLASLVLLFGAVFALGAGIHSIDSIHTSPLIHADGSALGIVSDGGPLPLCPPKCYGGGGKCNCNCCRLDAPPKVAPTESANPPKVPRVLADGSDPMPICRKIKTCGL
jgi:hypothetical protein